MGALHAGHQKEGQKLSERHSQKHWKPVQTTHVNIEDFMSLQESSKTFQVKLYTQGFFSAVCNTGLNSRAQLKVRELQVLSFLGVWPSMDKYGKLCSAGDHPGK